MILPAALKTEQQARDENKSAGLAVIAVLMTATPALCADWVEVGADTQANTYVDLDSIRSDGDNVSVLKRGIFTQVLTDTLGGTSATFKKPSARRNRLRAPHQIASRRST